MYGASPPKGLRTEDVRVLTGPLPSFIFPNNGPTAKPLKAGYVGQATSEGVTAERALNGLARHAAIFRTDFVVNAVVIGPDRERNYVAFGDGYRVME